MKEEKPSEELTFQVRFLSSQGPSLGSKGRATGGRLAMVAAMGVQAVGVGAPEPVEKVPAAQLRHVVADVAPEAVEKVPALQARQAVPAAGSA